MKIKESKFKISVLVFFILLLLTSGFISSIIKRYSGSWESIIKNKVNKNIKFIKESFAQKEKSVIKFAEETKKNLRVLLLKKDFSSFLEIYENSNYIINIYDSSRNLFLWNTNNFLDQKNLLEQGKLKESFFFNKDFTVYLTFIDTFNVRKNFYYLSVNLPLEKKFGLDNFENLSWSEFLSQKLNINVQIIYNNVSLIEDGKFYKFSLFNANNKKIASICFEKPTLDNLNNELESTIKTIQLVLLVIIFLVVIWLLIPKIKEQKNELLKFVFYVVIALAFRILLFVTNIPSVIFKNSVTEASYFSSKFAFGIVRSPLEFAITIVTVTVLVIVAYKNFVNYINKKKTNNRWGKFIFLIPLIFFLVLLVWRGLGASLRSVIFDSAIRYFKELNLIPDAPTFLMDFNILLLGLSAIIFSLILLQFLYSFNPLKNNKKSSLRLFVLLFLCLQISGYIFDVLQKQPQGTPLIRVIYITIIFFLLYLIVFENVKDIIRYVYIAFGASIATVNLLTYYNSKLEKESLKIIAQDLIRADKSIYQFMVYETLNNIVNSEEIINSYNQKQNMNLKAFEFWTKSLLYNESVPAFINFYDKEKKLIGSFIASKIRLNKDQLLTDEKNTEMINVEMIPNTYGTGIIIRGLAPVKTANKVLGYVAVGVLYDDINFRYVNIPSYLLKEQQDWTSVLNFERVKIFYFNEGRLVKFYGSNLLSKKDITQILSANFSEMNDAWMNIILDNEIYLFYLLRINPNKILAVGKEEKNMTWNISDFFKVFFVHSFLILIFVLVTALTNIRKLRQFLEGYQTKIVAGFILVSIVPLLIITIYYKKLFDANNEEILVKNITNESKRVINYLDKYKLTNIRNPELIFEKASQELGLQYSLFKDKNIAFSSVKNLYEANLVSNLIPPKAYFDIYYDGKIKSILKNKLGGNYYSIYSKLNFGSEEYILEINTLFNEYNINFSVKELNVFMFGIISLAAIMIIILSSFLANQISKPVKKLTQAARAVGSGDFDVNISGKYNGEMYELITGFNNMVYQLKKSQIELAKLERETAWKEMAKQVAHEIKNPLTPMKLSIQQLVAAYKDKSNKFDEIFNKVTNTIINQIEVLKNIANEFSEFARMPILNVKEISLKKVIENSVNLFSNEKVSIKYSIDNDDIIIYADDENLCRTFINMIRNSLQADAKNIFIIATKEKDFCEIRVVDDGIGITTEEINLIFNENFTTKKHGMGLGLSIAKKFLNSIGGDIEVEKTSKEGTTFLIKIPLVK
ncbi:MAG: ATP-binding protein [Melioribacter sp.]|nr:ATP-binding protein [Melioribacter sp.]